MLTIDPPSRLRILRAIVWTLVALVLLTYAALMMWPRRPAEVSATPAYATAFGGPFRLTDQYGRMVTDQTLAGKPFAIFFGFTRCAEVCPTTLQSMALLRKKLGSEGDKLNLVFVSLDPEHDKPSDIGQYLSLFGTPIIGLTGSQTELAQIVKAYHIYYKKVPIEGGDYVIDHTANVFLMGADGRFVGALSHGEDTAVALEKVKRLIADG